MSHRGPEESHAEEPDEHHEVAELPDVNHRVPEESHVEELESDGRHEEAEPPDED